MFVVRHTHAHTHTKQVHAIPTHVCPSHTEPWRKMAEDRPQPHSDTLLLGTWIHINRILGPRTKTIISSCRLEHSLLNLSIWSLLSLSYHKHPWLQAMFTSVGYRDSQGACGSKLKLFYSETWSGHMALGWRCGVCLVELPVQWLLKWGGHLAWGLKSKGEAFSLGSSTALELEQLPGSLLISLAAGIGYFYSPFLRPVLLFCALNVSPFHLAILL